MLKIHLRACNLFEATLFISNPTRSVIGFHADWWNSKSITYQVLINCICDDYDDQVILIIVQVLITYRLVTCVSKIKINLWSTRRRVLALAGHGKMSHHHNLLLTSSSWFMMTTAMMILKRLMIVALMKDRGCQRHGVVVCHLHLLKTFATINTTNYKTKEKTKTTNVFIATALFIPESFKRIDCSCWLNSVEWLWNWILTQFSPQKHDLRQAHIGICDSGTRLAVHCVGWQI